jgi:hypothetical protein
LRGGRLLSWHSKCLGLLHHASSASEPETHRRGKGKGHVRPVQDVGAYIVALSILMFAWSVFKTWEPPIQGRRAVATQIIETSVPVNTVLPTQVASE